MSKGWCHDYSLLKAINVHCSPAVLWRRLAASKAPVLIWLQIRKKVSHKRFYVHMINYVHSYISSDTCKNRTSRFSVRARHGRWPCMGMGWGRGAWSVTHPRGPTRLVSVAAGRYTESGRNVNFHLYHPAMIRKVKYDVFFGDNLASCSVSSIHSFPSSLILSL